MMKIQMDDPFVMLGLHEHRIPDISNEPEFGRRIAEINQFTKLVNVAGLQRGTTVPRLFNKFPIALVFTEACSLSANMQYILNRLVIPFLHMEHTAIHPDSENGLHFALFHKICLIYGGKDVDDRFLSAALPLKNSKKENLYGYPYRFENSLKYNADLATQRTLEFDYRHTLIRGQSGWHQSSPYGIPSALIFSHFYDRGGTHLNFVIFDFGEEPITYDTLCKAIATGNGVLHMYFRPIEVDDGIEVRTFMTYNKPHTQRLLKIRCSDSIICLPKREDYEQFIEGKRINTEPEQLLESIYYSLVLVDSMMTGVRLVYRMLTNVYNRVIKFKKKYPKNAKAFLKHVEMLAVN